MNQSWKINRKQFEAVAGKTVLGDYSGRKFRLEAVEHVTFHDLNWGGGTKNTYTAIVDGQTQTFRAPAPWANPIEGVTVEMPVGALLVEHSYFCGQDMGFRIYVNPANVRKFLGV